MNFDFAPLADLDLSIAQMQSIQTVYSKLKLNQAYWAETSQIFTENYFRLVYAAEAFGALPSWTAAAGILESGWFSTHSLFGVKATRLQIENNIDVQGEATHEVVGGISVPTVGDFFENPSVQNNFKNLFNYLARMKPNTAKYLPADVVGYGNYLQSEPAYSTAGQAYITSIISVIQSNGLNIFDKI